MAKLTDFFFASERLSYNLKNKRFPTSLIIMPYLSQTLPFPIRAAAEQTCYSHL